MPLSRRTFLSSLSLPAAAGLAGLALPRLSFGHSLSLLDELRGHPASAPDTAADEDFWAHVAQAFTIDRSVINLNNGGVSPSPGFVQEAHKRHLDFSNTTP